MSIRKVWLITASYGPLHSSLPVTMTRVNDDKAVALGSALLSLDSDKKPVREFRIDELTHLMSRDDMPPTVDAEHVNYIVPSWLSAAAAIRQGEEAPAFKHDSLHVNCSLIDACRAADAYVAELEKKKVDPTGFSQACDEVRAAGGHPAPVDKFAEAAKVSPPEMNAFSIADFQQGGPYTFNLQHPNVRMVWAEHSYTWEASKAAVDVVKERARQAGIEGFGTDHDDRQNDGALWKAAVSYAYAPGGMEAGHAPPTRWPWSDEWWKPSTRRRNLVKAAALLIAEIERLDRYEAKTAGPVGL